MSDTPGSAELYRLAHASFHDVAVTLSPDEWSAPVPCTPAPNCSTGGRRSNADIDAVLERWFDFGPSPLPIVE